VFRQHWQGSGTGNTDVSFAIGEQLSSEWKFPPLVEQDLTQFNRIDVCYPGGLSEIMKVTSWTEPHCIGMMPHNPLGLNCTAATAQFAGAVPNFAWLEAFIMHLDDWPWEAPHLERGDGTVTNWQSVSYSNLRMRVMASRMFSALFA
jgi:L-alanine-DL-glutamate epimerase-like enolase superfamily enzyme